MKILLVGTGGFAAGYIKNLLNREDQTVTWAGAVDPFITPENKALLAENNIPVFNTMEEYYVNHTADLTIICTPTYLHREQCIYALSQGSNVLCEKPLAPTEEDGRAMREAEKKYGKFIAIGFQWCYSKAILALKQDIMEGVLGKPLSLKTIVRWPRDLAYFGRSTGWAGSIMRNGKLVLDSIASNACAHYLQNMLFVLGNKIDESAVVAKLEGNCLRANAIENFDTCTLRMETEEGVKLYFAAAHPVEAQCNPIFEYRFEKATVTYAAAKGATIHARFTDGTEKDYGDPSGAADFRKIWDCVAAIRCGTTPTCTVKTALPHTMCIEKVYREIPITDFPQVAFNEEKQRREVPGLFEKLYKAYQEEKLLEEV